jgi:hypothetical protein
VPLLGRQAATLAEEDGCDDSTDDRHHESEKETLLKTNADGIEGALRVSLGHPNSPASPLRFG